MTFAQTTILMMVLATLFWRLLGAALAGRVHAHSIFFRYASSLAYAIVGAVILKLIVYPQGIINEVELGIRLAATLTALVVFFAFNRNVASSTWAGVFALLAINYFSS